MIGLHDKMTAREYHADPCPMPSLSRSTIFKLISESPKHAQYFHPRIGGNVEKKSSRAMDVGCLAHKLLLGKGDDIAVIDAVDYRSTAAKQQREDAYFSGKIPALPKDLVRAEAMVAAARRDLPPGALGNGGIPEAVLLWQENGVWLRAMLDWCPLSENQPIDDYKTTDGSASAAGWGKSSFNYGYDIQAALYARGWRAVFGVEPGPFRFLVQEQNPPYALNEIYMTQHVIENANKKVNTAIRKWKAGLETGKWEGHQRGGHVELPPWQMWSDDE